jgi:ubiquinone biosynthesis protein
MFNRTHRLREIQRIRKIVAVFVKYGFGHIIERIKLRRIGKTPTIKKELLERSAAERAKRAIEELGPIFTKLGQALSIRVDILPPEFISEFSKLQDRVNPLPFSKIKETMRNEYKKPISSVFPSVEETPIASASLAQVHSAKTFDGDDIVLKVKRPNIEDEILTDIYVLEDIARILERRIPTTKKYRPTMVVDEFKKKLLRELDFANEGRNIERFRRNFAGDETIFIPKVFWKLTTDRILVTERIKGVKLSDFTGLNSLNISRKEVANKGARIVLKQIFEDGFFHADPHPGNIFVMPDKKIAFCDFGMVGRIDERLKTILSELLIAGIEKDVDGIITGLGNLNIIREEIDYPNLRDDLEDLIDKYYGVGIGRVDMRVASEEFFSLTRKYDITLPRNLVLLLKTLGTLDGVGQELDPDFNTVEYVKPYAEKLIYEKWRPYNLAKTISEWAKDSIKLIKNLPEDLTQILSKTKRGKLRIEFEHRGLGNFMSTLDKVSSRLGASLIIAALIIGSSFLLRGEIKAIKIFGIIIFSISIVLGFVLLGGMLKSRQKT